MRSGDCKEWSKSVSLGMGHPGRAWAPCVVPLRSEAQASEGQNHLMSPRKSPSPLLVSGHGPAALTFQRLQTLSYIIYMKVLVNAPCFLPQWPAGCLTCCQFLRKFLSVFPL